MDSKLIQNVSEEVYRRFPEVRGKKPKVQAIDPNEGRSIVKSPTHLLIFQGQAVTSTQKSLPYLVRVVVDEQGKILKISMSH